MKTKWISWLIAITLIISVLIGGCSSQTTSPSPSTSTTDQQKSDAANTQTSSPTIDAIKKNGVIKIGVSLKFPPVQFRDSNGQPAGFDVDVATMLAADLKVKPEFVDLEWDALIPALLSGKVDILWAGHTNTPERALSVEFSDRLEKTDVVMVVPKDSKVKSINDLNDPSKTIAVLLGSTSEKAAKLIFSKAKIRSLDQQAAIMETESGRADATVLDLYTAAPYVKQHTNAKVLTDATGAPIVVSREYGHAAMRKGDLAFKNYINNWIDYYRAAGTLDGLEQKWLGPVTKLD